MNMATYAVADIHGNGILWDKIKNFLKPDDKCYILGDLIDRGLSGYRMAKEALEDERFIYLLGDHEEMFVNAACFYPQWDTDNFFVYISNGGAHTWEQWEMNGADKEFVKKIRYLPRTAEYKSKDGYIFLLSHSGWDFNESLTPPKDTLWDREHFKTETKSFVPSEYIMIHGHTPIQYLSSWDKYEIGALFYDDGLKIDIDMGTEITKSVCLFNMDTFEEVIIHE